MNDTRQARAADEAPSLEQWTDRVHEALQADDRERVLGLIGRLHPATVADILEALPGPEREALWGTIADPALKGELLVQVRHGVRNRLIESTSPEELADAVAGLELDELADLYEQLPRKVVRAVLRVMDTQRRRRLRRVLSYPHDTAGGLMDADALAVREDVGLATALRYLRRVRHEEGRLPEHTAALMVVDRYDRYRGMLYLADLVSLDSGMRVADAMTHVEGIQAETPASQVARLFEDRDLVSAPVVDADGRLIGRITIDDVVDTIRRESERSLLKPAGLEQHEDMFAPYPLAARRRGVWLAVNLFNAFAASWVIGLFGASIEQRVALAVLMPIVANMGGVAGIQTLTLVTRGLALDQVSRANTLRLLGHEIVVTAIVGTGLGLLLGVVAFAWFRDPGLGLVFGCAVFVNLLNAALSGTLIPVLLDRLGVDPALAGGVMLTALTDIIGFFSFLGLAAWLLL